MSDPFRDRIENLLREGKISPEEANKLFRALEAQGETVEKSTPTVGQGSSGPAIPTPVKPVAPTPQHNPRLQSNRSSRHRSQTIQRPATSRRTKFTNSHSMARCKM